MLNWTIKNIPEKFKKKQFPKYKSFTFTSLNKNKGN